jgi:hypothetical protein
LSRIPTIRIKSENQAHEHGYFIRNHDDLRYGETLFKAEEFESLGEHEVRLKLESSPPDEFFLAEAKLWLELKAEQCKTDDEANRSAREIETLSIAKLLSRIAICAIIIPIIMAIVGNHVQILSFIFKTP